MTKRANYNKIVRAIRIVLTVSSFLPLVIFGGIAIAKGLEALVARDLFLVYVLVIAFTLPLVFAKVVLKSGFFSLKSVYLFLCYPGMYLLAFVLAKMGTNMLTLYTFFGALAIFIWHILLAKYFVTEDFDQLDDASTKVFIALIGLVVFLFVISFLRDYASIVSTDILAHKTVINGMKSTDTLYLMPAGYSNMFTDQGYPIVFYHTFLFFVQNSFGFDFVKLAYYIDFVFTFVSALVLAKLFVKYFKNYIWALIGILITIFVFETNAFTVHYFLPQTFAFWFFLQIFSNHPLKIKQLALAVPVLITSHLFMGTYMAGLLVLAYFYLERYLILKSRYKVSLFFEGTLLLLLVIFTSYAGFSVENSFQKTTLEEIGLLSNPLFGEKFAAIGALFGVGTLVLGFALVRLYFAKKRKFEEYFAFMVILLGAIFYFLGPTFAAKFFLGFGFFGAIIIVEYLKRIKFTNAFIKYGAIMLLIIGLGVNFAQQYYNLLPFLKQSNGFQSAIVHKDEDLIRFWQSTQPECMVLSDPETQIELHSVGEGNSAHGYYMTLPSRKIMSDFISTPSEELLGQFYNFEEVTDSSTSLCFIMTSRFRELVDGDYPWANIIYNYKVDQGAELSESDKVLQFMRGKYSSIYQDPYNVVYRIR